MENTNIILSFLFCIIDTLIFINILSAFRNNKDIYNLMDSIVVIGVSVAIFLFTKLGIIPYVKVILISILLFLITFLYNLKSYQRLLTVILYYFILIVSELLVTLLISNILGIGIEAIQENNKYSFFFLGAISKFLAILILSLVKRKFTDRMIILPEVLNYITILILLLSTVSMVLLFYSNLNLSTENIQFTLFLICLFTLFSSMGILIIYFYANTFYVDLQKETTKRVYNKSYEKFISNAELRNDTLSKIWHDIGNHIKVLEKMNEIENDTHIEYINSIKDKLKAVPNAINTGNKLIDVILNDKYAETTMHGIDFDIKAIAPPILNIDDMDLSSILFNTIDNAIEACLNCSEESRYISLDIFLDGNFLCFKIRNNYTPIKNNSSKKTYFNKKPYISSGYGLSIVEDIVNKYDGYMYIKKDHKEYSVKIVLNLSNHLIQETTT